MMEVDTSMAEAIQKRTGGKATANGKAVTLDISESMSFWIGILVIALVAYLILADTPTFTKGTEGYLILNEIYMFILFGPGLLILPAIVGVVIGRQIGIKSEKLVTTLKRGILEAIYGTIIYIISVSIIYEVMIYTIANSMLNLNALITNWIVVPSVIFIVLVELLSWVSFSRKSATS